MAKPCRPFIKLSSNEIANVLCDEKKKWKIFRLQQVRAQSREKTSAILQAANKEEEKLKFLLRHQVNREWLKENQRKLQPLEEEYAECLLKFGEAHVRAETERNAIQTYMYRKVEDNKRAAERGKEALHMLNKTKTEAKNEEANIRLKRQILLEREKRRANIVAQMPTPPRFKPQRRSPVKHKKRVKFYEAGTCTTSSYVPSSIRVVKEDGKEEVSAREAARHEREKSELVQTLKTLKDRENEKKIQERADIARKKVRTRKMYSQLMSELAEAEQNHELSDFFQQSDDSSGSQRFLSRGLGVDLQKREREAEKRVEQIMKETDDEIKKREEQIWKAEETEKSEFFLAKIKGRSSFPPSVENGMPQLTEVSQSERVEIVPRQDIPTPTQSEGKQDQVSFPPTGVDLTIDSDAIHFKETVPMHKLPIVKEKFVVKKPSEQPSQIPSVLVESSRTESSFEEIKVKIDFQPVSSGTTISASSGEGSSPDSREENFSSFSTSTEYRKYSQLLRKKLDENRRRLAEISPGATLPSESSSSGSTSSTSYQGVPKSSPGDESENQLLSENVKQIQESRINIKKIIEELKRPSYDAVTTKVAEKDFRTFKTPPRIYKEPLKTDSSSERPRTKRQKFAVQKRRLLQHYMQRLMHMKQDELKRLTASTVSGSVIDMSSETYLNKMCEKKRDLTFPSFSSIGSPIFKQWDNELETVPTKLSSGLSDIPEVLSSTDVSAEDSFPTSSSVSQGNSSNGEIQTQKQGILLRMLQLQKLKKQLIIQQQKALGRDVEAIQPYQSTTSSKDSSQSSLNAESSVEWSSLTTYQTPSREDSTLSKSKFSPSSPVVSHPGPQTIVVRRGLPLISSHHRFDGQRPASEETLDPEKTSDVDRNIQEQPLPTPRPNDPQQRSTTSESSHRDTSTGSSHSTPSDARAKKGEARKESSSSVTSLPDMGQVLKNFGLDWAVSMIKKMDIAEEVQSSDKSNI